jgi:hypothetical protein
MGDTMKRKDLIAEFEKDYKKLTISEMEAVIVVIHALIKDRERRKKLKGKEA